MRIIFFVQPIYDLIKKMSTHKLVISLNSKSEGKWLTQRGSVNRFLSKDQTLLVKAAAEGITEQMWFGPKKGYKLMIKKDIWPRWKVSKKT